MRTLPPPPNILNEEHAKRVNKTSKTITIGGYSFGADGATDILTDLRHWCRFHDIRFEQCLATSGNHFQNETTP